MEYIKRQLEDKILELSKEYAGILLTGPRQVGKTTTLMHIKEDNRTYVTLDDLNERRLAKRGPGTVFPNAQTADFD